MPSCLAKIYMILLILSLRSVVVMTDKGRFCSFGSCDSLQTLLKWGLEVGGWCLQLWCHQTIILRVCVPVFSVSSLFQIPRASLFSQLSSGVALTLRVVWVFRVQWHILHSGLSCGVHSATQVPTDLLVQPRSTPDQYTLWTHSWEQLWSGCGLYLIYD